MKRLSEWYLGLNIYYKLAPLLLFYLTATIIIFTVFKENVLIGDECRYIKFANNLLKGFYSPPYPDIDLWNGPGYPLLLAPFIFFKLPLLALRLLNGFLLYFSLIVSCKTFKIYSPDRNAFLGAAFLGLYFAIYEWLPFIMTECFAWFLMSCICYFLTKSYIQKNISWKFVLLAAFSIAYLAMTKIIFGYVILSMLSISAFMCLLPDFRSYAVKSFLIFLISFVFCLPWLAYTYSLTNKLFYWADGGGVSLYAMSTPYANEFGEADELDAYDEGLTTNHKAILDRVAKLTPLERDEAFKIAAINNIKSHPQKYIFNWSANIGRLLFSYPYSYRTQTMRSYFTLVPNMFIVVLIVLSLPVSILYYKKFPEGFILLFPFVLIYLFGSTLLTAYPRMFYITVPFWFFYFSYFFNNIVSIKINQN